MNNKIIEITTPTCSVCKMLKPVLGMIMPKFYPNIELIVVDHEEELAKKYLEEYSIKSVPAFFFTKDDKVIKTHFGAITVPDFKNIVDEVYTDEC